MAKKVASIIADMPPITGVIESSLYDHNAIEITEHGFGVDIAQNGLVVHVDHSQIDDLIQILEGVA